MNWNLNECPQLETERLLLRVPTADDFEPLAAIYGDAQTMEFIGGAMDKDFVWRTLATFIGHWCMTGYGLFSAIEKSTGAFVGRAGIINPHGWPAPEIGWVIARERWGEGFATEAARAILEHEVARIRPTRLISLVDERNERSRRVAEKLGARNGGTTEYLGAPTNVFVYGLPDAPLVPELRG